MHYISAAKDYRLVRKSEAYKGLGDDQNIKQKTSGSPYNNVIYSIKVQLYRPIMDDLVQLFHHD